MMKVTASIIFAVSSFISLIFMTRYVGEAYGMMMWGMSLVAIFNTALDMGFNDANIKKVSEGMDLKKCVSTYLAIRTVISVMTVVLVLLSAVLMDHFNGGFPTEFWMVTGVFVLYFVLDNLLVVMSSTFIGHMDAGKESATLVTSHLIRATCLIVFAVMGASAVVLSFGYVIGTSCALVVSYILFRSLKVRLVRPAFFKEYWSFAAPLVVPLVLIAVVTYIDKVMIGAFFNEMEVGYYTAAMGIIFALISLGAVMNGLLLSHMSRLRREGKTGEARNTLWAAQKYLAVLMLPATVFLLMFGNETAVALFKVSFAASGPVLSVLALNIYLVVLSGMFCQVLFSMDRTASYGKAAVVYGILALLLFFVLIPGRLFEDVYGATGAAAAVVIASFVFVIMLAVTIKRLGGPSVYPRIYIHVGAALILMAVLYLVKIYLEPSGVIELVLLALASLVLYGAILVAVKEISRKDIRFIRDTLDPRNIYEDLRGEMREK